MEKGNNNEYIYEKVSQEFMQYMVEDDINNLLNNIKRKYKDLNVYNYKVFNPNNTYSFQNFSNTNTKNNNSNKFTNYEKIANKSYYLIVNKLMLQALGALETLYLSEMSRLSVSLPVNEYGFFSISRKHIYEDIGISPKQQDRICSKLEKIGLITTVTYKQEMTKFYKFNDDEVLKFYLDKYKYTCRRIKYKGDR